MYSLRVCRYREEGLASGRENGVGAVKAKEEKIRCRMFVHGDPIDRSIVQRYRSPSKSSLLSTAYLSPLLVRFLSPFFPFFLSCSRVSLLLYRERFCLRIYTSITKF